MPQRDVLLPWLSALDNAGLALRARGASRDRARQRAAPWFERFGLAGFEGARPAELSCWAIGSWCSRRVPAGQWRTSRSIWRGHVTGPTRRWLRYGSERSRRWRWRHEAAVERLASAAGARCAGRHLGAVRRPRRRQL